jgi:YD repeat-containing protein
VYAYNANGSVDTVTLYDGGTGAATTYGYDTTSGELLTRDFPVQSAQNIRTTYAYDAAGRLEYETITREGGGTTNLYRTQYGYSNLSYGQQTVRTEQAYSGSWVNEARLTYRTTAQKDWSVLMGFCIMKRNSIKSAVASLLFIELVTAYSVWSWHEKIVTGHMFSQDIGKYHLSILFLIINSIMILLFFIGVLLAKNENGSTGENNTQ